MHFNLTENSIWGGYGIRVGRVLERVDVQVGEGGTGRKGRYVSGIMRTDYIVINSASDSVCEGNMVETSDTFCSAAGFRSARGII